MERLRRKQITTLRREPSYNVIIEKFTTMLVNNYDRIAIEDLAVKQMQMSRV